LVSATGASGTSTYTYDASGTLLVTHDAQGARLHLPTGVEIQLAPDGTTLTSSRYYTFAGVTYAVRTPAGLSWLATDPHGSAQLAINATTGAATTHLQDPFGVPLDTASLPGDHGFVGGIQHPTGLTLLGARSYDPTLGRFTTPDPILDPADPQQYAAYSYANNNPTSMSDPAGLAAMACADGPGGICMGPSGKTVGTAPTPHKGGSEVYTTYTTYTTYTPPPPPPPVQKCDWWCYLAPIVKAVAPVVVQIVVTVVVFTGCEAATGGVGSVGCVIGANAAGGAASGALDAALDGGSASDIATGALLGGVAGATGAGAGRLLEKGAVKLAEKTAARAAEKAAAHGDDLLKPGPWAADSVPSSAPGKITAAERAALKPIGDTYGCHSCGAIKPGTKSGNWVGDHQPVSRTVPAGTPQVLYPHCLSCSNEQGLWIINLIRRGKL
jgi:RHS repeat-associated protein